MRNFFVFVLFVCGLATVWAGYCTETYRCGSSCSWFRCKARYCTRNKCCTGFCGTNCLTPCANLCPKTYTCDKTCYRKSCTRNWWFTRCSNKSYSCKGTCTRTECCPGWKGKDCTEKDKIEIQ